MSVIGELTESLGVHYAPIAHELQQVETVFDAELDGDLPFINELCETVRSYRGKMLRPALLLLTGRAAGNLTDAHVTLAAVVEMVHMATLVHDDVLDEADQRRRRPTINRIAGNEAAVLLGDYLISHAFHLCSGLDSQFASRRIGATTNTVCEGELLQNHYRGCTDLSESTYFDIIGRKTAALTATACELGAYYAEADPPTVAAARQFGMDAGLAFQIVDDLLDVVGERSQVGKTLGRDAELGKLTLPTIHALASVNGRERESILNRLGDSESAGGALRSILEQTGSIEYALTAARTHVERAIRALDALQPGDARASLTALAEFILARRM